MSGILSTRSTWQCIRPECDEHVSAKGLCKSHYDQHRKATSDGVRTGGVRKLTDEQCSAIRRRSAALATTTAIAAEFGVGIPTIRAVLKRTGAYAPKADA